MNVKIAPESIRFRITADEFEFLLKHGALSNNTSFGGEVNFYYEIRTHRDPTNSAGQCATLDARVSHGTICTTLIIFADGIAKLQLHRGGKEGISEYLSFENGDMLTISLDIDLHTQKGSAKS